MKEIEARPTPQLWNAISFVYQEEVDVHSCRQALLRALIGIGETNGRLPDGRYYLDPAVNLFRVFYGERDFAQAFTTLNKLF